MASNFQNTNDRGGEVTLHLFKHYDSVAAIRVTSNEDDDAERDGEWLPLSQISYHPQVKKGYVDVVLPQWLAKAKGFA